MGGALKGACQEGSLTGGESGGGGSPEAGIPKGMWKSGGREHIGKKTDRDEPSGGGKAKQAPAQHGEPGKGSR